MNPEDQCLCQWIQIFGVTGLLCWCCQDLEVVTRFLPAMMSVVVDDNIFTVEQKLPSEEKSSQVYPTLLPDAFYRWRTHTFLPHFLSITGRFLYLSYYRIQSIWYAVSFILEKFCSQRRETLRSVKVEGRRQMHKSHAEAAETLDRLHTYRYVGAPGWDELEKTMMPKLKWTNFSVNIERASKRELAMS